MTRISSPSLALAYLLGPLAIGCGHQAADPTAKAASDKAAARALPIIRVAPVHVSAMDQELPLTGTLETLPNRQVTVKPSVSGILDEFPIRFGEAIRQGEIIAHVSTRQLLGQIQQAKAALAQDEVKVQQAQVTALQQQAQTSTAVEQAQAALAEARAKLAEAQAAQTGNDATLSNAKESLVREQTLFQEGLVAEKDVQAAQLAVRTAEAQLSAQRQAVAAQRQTVEGQRHAVAAAQAGRMQSVVSRKEVEVARQQVANARGALATARAQLALYTLRSPLTGRVASVGASLGETVDPSTRLATIANLDALQLRIAVPATSATQVHLGQQVNFEISSLPGQFFHTTISTVGKEVDPSTNAVPAFAVVVNRGQRLKANTVVQVRVVIARHSDALLVPKSALLTDPNTDQTTVTVVGSDAVAHIKPVRVGLTAGSEAEITRGLSPGDRVAVAGQYGLSDGTKVSVENAP